MRSIHRGCLCLLALGMGVACGSEADKTADVGSKSTVQAGDAATPSPAVALSGNAEIKLSLRTWAQELYPVGQYNQEQEAYTNGGNNVVFDANGGAVIKAIQTSSTTWTSARLSGPNLAELTDSLPIYLEATVRTPSAVGTWPAFWLLGRGLWPIVGEIDIMEQINGDGNSYASTHWSAKPGNPSFDTSFVAATLDLTQFHRYGAYLSSAGIQFYVDGQAKGALVVFPKEANFAALVPNMFPILNLAIGGQWPGKAPTNTGNQQLEIQQVIARKTPPSQ